MADREVTDNTELTSPDYDDDLMLIVDVSDTTDDTDGTLKNVKPENLRVKESRQSIHTGALSTDDTYEGTVIEDVNAGEVITQWDLVYYDSTDSEWKQADANVSAEFPAWGFAVDAGTDGNPLTVLIEGIIRNDGWNTNHANWTPNTLLYLSETAGGLTHTAPSDSGDCVQPVARVIICANGGQCRLRVSVNPIHGWATAP